MTGRAVAAAAVLAASSVVHAADVSDGQASQLFSLLGFEQAVHAFARDSVEKTPLFSALASSQRECVGGLIEEIVGVNTRQRLQEIFEDSAHAESWIAFAETRAGEPVMAYVASGAAAAFGGQPRPDETALLTGLKPEDAELAAKFLSSPAGQVFGAAPPVKPSAMTVAQQTQLGDDVMRRCEFSERDFS